jgi:hypothetical protein
MDEHTHPYLSLFRKYVPDLGPPDSDGWASGSCPFCGEVDTFRVNLKSGRWVCLPTPIPPYSIHKAGKFIESGTSVLDCGGQ